MNYVKSKLLLSEKPWVTSSGEDMYWTLEGYDAESLSMGAIYDLETTADEMKKNNETERYVYCKGEVVYFDEDRAKTGHWNYLEE